MPTVAHVAVHRHPPGPVLADPIARHARLCRQLQRGEPGAGDGDGRPCGGPGGEPGSGAVSGEWSTGRAPLRLDPRLPHLVVRPDRRRCPSSTSTSSRSAMRRTQAPTLGVPDAFNSATVGVKKLQAALGVTQTGLTFGQAVFVPTAARVTSVSATLGAAAPAGQPVLSATSTTRQVSIALDASQQSEVKVGDKVSITLPNNQATPGVISSVGTVASAPHRIVRTPRRRSPSSSSRPTRPPPGPGTRHR